FRLVVDNRVRRIDDLSRYLLTTVRGQAMHEHSIAGGQGEELLVDLVRRKNLLAQRRLVLLAHAGPHVSVDSVGPGGRGNRIFGDFNDGAGFLSDLPGSLHDLRVRGITVRRGYGDTASQAGRGQQQRMGDVVAVTDIRHVNFAEIAEFFLQG